MTTSAASDLLVRYLLGELSPEERANLERSLFTEPRFLDSVRVAEEELIRDELVGALPPDRLARFYSYFLSFPDLRAKYEATKSLRECLGPPATAKRLEAAVPIDMYAPPSRSPSGIHLARWLLGAVAAVMLFLAVDDFRLRSQVNGALTTATLVPGLLRSAASAPVRVSIPPEAVLVQINLQVELSDRHSAYDAVLTTVEGRQEIIRLNRLPATKSSGFQHVRVEIPASLLPPGSYVLALNGLTSGSPELVETYSFDTVRIEDEH